MCMWTTIKQQKEKLKKYLNKCREIMFMDQTIQYFYDGNLSHIHLKYNAAHYTGKN